MSLVVYLVGEYKMINYEGNKKEGETNNRRGKSEKILSAKFSMMRSKKIT